MPKPFAVALLLLIVSPAVGAVDLGDPLPDPVFRDGFESGNTAAWAFEPPALAGILAAHNEVRSAHGVRSLMWSSFLAATAQAWAEQCVDVAPPVGLLDHNPNRHDGYPWFVGENIAGNGGPISGAGAVSIWAAEEIYYDYETNTCEPGQVCGHYTQVVWEATEWVGCGVYDCPAITFGYSVVCNYGPTGNTGGLPY
jgi:hypothetical protein